MEQWDVICIRCGKHLFSEQRASTAGDIHRLHETNDEFYDEIKAEFYTYKHSSNSRPLAGCCCVLFLLLFSLSFLLSYATLYTFTSPFSNTHLYIFFITSSLHSCSSYVIPSS